MQVAGAVWKGMVLVQMLAWSSWAVSPLEALRMREGGRHGKTNSSGWEGGGAVKGVDRAGSAQKWGLSTRMAQVHRKLGEAGSREASARRGVVVAISDMAAAESLPSSEKSSCLLERCLHSQLVMEAMGLVLMAALKVLTCATGAA
jgi:hypothetical protein